MRNCGLLLQELKRFRGGSTGSTAADDPASVELDDHCDIFFALVLHFLFFVFFSFLIFSF